MKKLQTYKTFEDHIIRDENYIPGNDDNYEEEIDKVLALLLQQKVLVEMLGDTINHVSKQIEKVLPSPIEPFTNALKHYDDDVFVCVSDIIENMIQGYPNLKDLIDDVEQDMKELEKYLELKGVLKTIQGL